MRNIDVIADHTTWCSKDIKSGVNLAKILNEIGDGNIIGKVNVAISGFDNKLAGMKEIREKTTIGVKYLTDLVHKDTILNIKSNIFPHLVETHLLNLISTKYKIFLNGKRVNN